MIHFILATIQFIVSSTSDNSLTKQLDRGSKVIGPHSWHGGTNRMTNRNARRLKVLQAEDVDSEIVWGDTLSVKRIDAADFAEVVASRLGMKLILGQEFRARQEPEFAFVNLDHQRVLSAANRAIAHGEFREISFDLELDRPAVAAAGVLLHWSRVHFLRAPE
jgi:hypothetical protein